MKRRALLIISLLAIMILTATACASTVDYHTVKFSANGISFIPDKAVKDGDKISKPQDPYLEGATFIGWFIGEEPWDFENDTVTSDITLTASFEKNSYKVTFITSDDSSYDIYLNYGDKIPEPQVPEKEFYDFTGWYNGKTAWIFDTGTVTENIILTAGWNKIPTFSVTFDANGGTSVSPQLVYRDNKINTPESTTKEGHDLVGWYLGDTPWNFDSDTVNKDIVLTAKWTPYPTYTVSFETGDGTKVENQYIVVGGLISKPTDPTMNLHKFDGWYYEGAKWDFSMPVTDNMSLTAVWIPSPTYEVTFNTMSIDSLTTDYTVEPQYIPENGTAKAPFTPNISPLATGYKFVGWYYNDELWDFSTPVTENMTLTAAVIRVYCVTLDMGEDVSGESFDVYEFFYVEEGEKLNLNITPTYPLEEYEDVWQFIGWYNADDTEWDPDTVIDEDITIYAGWAPMLPVHPF